MGALRVEIVRTSVAGPGDDPEDRFHARVKAENGEIIWVTESYTRRWTAEEAVRLLGTLPVDPAVTFVDEGVEEV